MSTGDPRCSPFADLNAFGSFRSQCLAAEGDGTAINKVFPLAFRVATMPIGGLPGTSTNGIPAKLISVSLASSLLVAVAADTMGLYVGLDIGPIINLNGAANIFCDHIALTNSTNTSPNSSSRSTSVDFGVGLGFPVPSGQNVAIYASSANDATNLFAAVATFFWIPTAS